MSHREHLMEKLGLHNRTDLIRFALRREIIQAQ
jgi:DNA-binding NarL/FixJ family response regulator